MGLAGLVGLVGVAGLERVMVDVGVMVDVDIDVVGHGVIARILGHVAGEERVELPRCLELLEEAEDIGLLLAGPEGVPGIRRWGGAEKVGERDAGR
jgi:hypothetical protein